MPHVLYPARMGDGYSKVSQTSSLLLVIVQQTGCGYAGIETLFLLVAASGASLEARLTNRNVPMAAKMAMPIVYRLDMV